MTNAIDNLMQHGLDDGVFPSAQLIAASKNGVLIDKAYGNATLETVFDVASLTKPISTVSLTMNMVEKDILRLDDKIPQYLPACKNSFKDKITIRHLLSHSSGLPAWQAYYQLLPRADIGKPSGKKLVVDFICNEELVYKTGYESVYSDLGFILLGEVIERVGKKTLDKLFAEQIAGPLGLNSTFFVPLCQRPPKAGPPPAGTNAPAHQFAPTEDCPWRKKILRGEVHDQNCFAMGGVAGHAGLFSNTNDINKFISNLVNDYKNGREVTLRFLPFRDKLTECNSTWLIGWDRPSHINSQAGRYFSDSSIGHLGYTGCSMWIDLKKEFWIVLLTNRVHPTTMNEKIKSFRPTIYNLVCEEFFR